MVARQHAEPLRECCVFEPRTDAEVTAEHAQRLGDVRGGEAVEAGKEVGVSIKTVAPREVGNLRLQLLSDLAHGRPRGGRSARCVAPDDLVQHARDAIRRGVFGRRSGVVRLRRIDPVALALERIGRQHDLAARSAGSKAAQSIATPCTYSAARLSSICVPVAAAAAQRRQPQPRSVAARHCCAMPSSVGCGPISRNASQPLRSSACIAVGERTGSRTCSRQ